jgi:hypothetical protein
MDMITRRVLVEKHSQYVVCHYLISDESTFRILKVKPIYSKEELENAVYSLLLNNRITLTDRDFMLKKNCVDFWLVFANENDDVIFWADRVILKSSCKVIVKNHV